VRTLRISSGIHSDIVTDYLAKHAINLLRLELLSDTTTRGNGGPALA